MIDATSIHRSIVRIVRTVTYRAKDYRYLYPSMGERAIDLGIVGEVNAMGGRPISTLGLVEESLRFDLRHVRLHGNSSGARLQHVFEGTDICVGVVAAKWCADEIAVRFMDLEVYDDDANLILRQRISVEYSRPYFGGQRPWLVCPMERENVSCGKRVRSVYLPPGSDSFGCRECHDLTYQSCRDSHRYDAMFAGLSQLIPGLSVDSMRKHLIGAPR
jgi:hypothetical protein